MSTGIETIHRISSTTHELTTRYGKWQAFREACRLHGAKVPTETAPVERRSGGTSAPAAFVVPITEPATFEEALAAAESSTLVQLAKERARAAEAAKVQIAKASPPAATSGDSLLVQTAKAKAAAAASDPLQRAVERLIAAGQATAEAPGAGDPLQRACDRLAGK